MKPAFGLPNVLTRSFTTSVTGSRTPRNVCGRVSTLWSMMSGGVPAWTIAVSFWFRSDPPWKPAMYEMSICQPWALPHSSSSKRTNALWSGWKSWFCRICSFPFTLALDFGIWSALTASTTLCDGGGVAVAAPPAAGLAAAAGLVAAAAGLVAAAAGLPAAAGLVAAAGALVAAGADVAAGFGASVGFAGAVVGAAVGAAPPHACSSAPAAGSPSANPVHDRKRRRPRLRERGSEDMKLLPPNARDGRRPKRREYRREQSGCQRVAAGRANL